MSVVGKTLQENYVFFVRELTRIDAALAALPKGGISAKKIGGATYYYRQWREGDKVKSVSLGREPPPEFTEAAAKRKQLERQRREVLENISVIVRAVDTQRVTVDEILRLFSTHGINLVLAGSYCIPVLRENLGLNLPTIRTQDVDFMVASPYHGKPADVGSLVGELGFYTGFNPDGSTFFTNGVFKVEFLTPEKGHGSEKAVPINRLKIVAQPLRYLGMLGDGPLEFKVGGFSVTVPNPWALAFHKILVSRERKSADKRDKDMLQAAALLREIQKNADFLSKARACFDGLPPRWRQHIKAVVLETVPEWEF